MKAEKSSTRAGAPGLVDARFGNVTVRVRASTAAEQDKGVEASTQALKRLAGRLAKPLQGPTILRKVPRFFVDPGHPGWLLRSLGGKLSAGKMVGGRFVVNRAATARVRAVPMPERSAKRPTGT